MIIENRDALLKERELAHAVFWYVQEPAVLPPVLKKSMRK